MTQAIGRYEIVKQLATGGMGQIYLAKQKGPKGFEKLVVVKRLLSHLAADEEFVAMFLDEARIAAALTHPNIAQLYELGEEGDTYYIAMEYVCGDSLWGIGQRARELELPMPLPLECRVIAEAARGLDYAHHSKTASGAPLSLIHRDVSPQNVLVSFLGGVKLIDFGMAKAVGKLSKTAVGTIKGKYAYMSPEQARGEPLDLRSDVFALGIVFYELLTGTRLFRRESQVATLKAIVHEKVPAPSKLAARVPKAIDAIVLKALTKERDGRFQTAAELQLALEEYLAQHQLAATTADLSAYMERLYPEAAQANPLSAPSSPSPQKAPATLPLDAELDRRLRLARPKDMARGLFFNAILSAVSRHAGPEAEARARAAAQDPRPYVDSKSYPTAELLRVLWKAAQKLSPRLGGTEKAFAELGGACLERLARSPAGGALELAGSATPPAILEALLETLDALLTPSDRTLTSSKAHAATLRFRGELLPPAFYAGFLGRALREATGIKLSIQSQPLSSTEALFELSW